MFFKKDKNESNNLSKVAALLIHAAKIDENFSKSEEVIIKQALLQIGVDNENLERISANSQIFVIIRCRHICKESGLDTF